MTNVGAASEIQDGAAGGLSLFGFTFTSKILGILIGVAGIGLAAYVTTSYVMPLWDQVQTGQTNIATKKTGLTSLEQKVAAKANIAQKIEEANKQNQFVLSLLPSVDNVDTLIRDIQDQIPKKITFTTLGFVYDIDGTLRIFQPKEVVKGPQFNTYSFTIGFDGKFEDVLTTLQKIERLKPLLVIKDLKLTKKSIPTDRFNFKGRISPEKEKDVLESFPPLIGADFNLEAFVPLTEAELKASAAVAVPPKK